MARVRSRDTLPELAVRKQLHALGFRFRLHRSSLPGSPDVVLPHQKTVVMCHGCYWHRHSFGGRRTVATPDRVVSELTRAVDTRCVLQRTEHWCATGSGTSFHPLSSRPSRVPCHATTPVGGGMACEGGIWPLFQGVRERPPGGSSNMCFWDAYGARQCAATPELLSAARALKRARWASSAATSCSRAAITV